MDETTKVIIATVSGFIIAFFAEPVKTYFQNKSKLKNLRIALYKEVLHNYVMMTSFMENEDTGEREMGEYLAGQILRTECYKNAVQNEVALFYQLEEAILFNVLEGGMLSMMINLSSDVKGLFGRKVPKDASSKGFMVFTEQYKNIFTTACYSGKLCQPPQFSTSHK